MPFEPITTQEVLDSLLQHERSQFDGWLSPDAVKQQYQGWLSPDAVGALKTEHQKALGERDEKIQKLETQALRERIARESGLPSYLADRLTGKDEAALREDAKAMACAIGKPTGYPVGSEEKSLGKKETANAALRAAFGLS